MIWVLGALWVLRAAPCAPPPADLPGAADAPAYLEVAEDARHQGLPEAARIAYREVLRRDPANPVALAGLRATCPTDSPAFEVALEKMQAGDLRGAASLFAAERDRTEVPDPAGALLEGICRYQLGEDAKATELLALAAQQPDLAASAQLFEGLIALRTLRTEQARALFAQLDQGSDSTLRAATSPLRRLAARQGRLVVSAAAEGGYDSNVDLTPDGTPIAGESADANASLTASLCARPAPATGLYLRLDGHLRQQLTISGFNLQALEAAAGWELARGGRHLMLEYGYSAAALGGAPYLFAHRASALLQLPVEPFRLGVEESARLESYPGAEFSPYSGLRHLGSAFLTRQWPSLALTFRYALGGDLAQTPSLGYLEHGPGAQLEWGDGLWTALLEVRMLWRTYAELDPALGTVRQDQLFEASAVARWDLGERWSLRGGLGLRRASSNVPSFSSTEVLAQVGVLYAAGFF